MIIVELNMDCNHLLHPEYDRGLAVGAITTLLN